VEALVVIVVIVVLFAVFMPAMSNRSVRAPRIMCANNLKQVGLAFRIFANDHGDTYPMNVSTNKGGSLEYVATGEVFRHFRAMSNELSTPRILICPSDTRKAASSFLTLSNTNISYFVGLDAADSFPQMLLSGDRNLMTNGVPVGSGLLVLTTNSVVGWTSAVHQNSANILLGDGSVQQATSSRLGDRVANSGMATNRLVIP
jgi:prepilin-type processing-associated H-X9-DG protein